MLIFTEKILDMTKRNIMPVLFLFFCSVSFAQELSCTVSIDAQQTGKTQLSVFNTLQRSLEDFVNNTRWSNRNLPQNQRINCSFFMIVHQYAEDNFEASLQIQSSRPVYGSTMVTPVFNYRDNRVNFTYQEHQPLRFNPNSFESNLTSTIGFYVYLMLGLDADSFAPDGGNEYFSTASQVAGNAQQNGASGWDMSANTGRYAFNRLLSSTSYQDFHQAVYLYHRQGLDVMYQNVAAGKENIAEAVRLLYKTHRDARSAPLIRVFFDAKAKEIFDIFKTGPRVETAQLVQNLNAMAPAYSGQWQQLPL